MVNLTAYDEMARTIRFLEREMATFENTICPCNLPSCVERRARPRSETREARLEEIERRRDSVLAECNPNLPTYEAK